MPRRRRLVVVDRVLHVHDRRRAAARLSGRRHGNPRISPRSPSWVAARPLQIPHRDTPCEGGTSATVVRDDADRRLLVALSFSLNTRCGARNKHAKEDSGSYRCANKCNRTDRRQDYPCEPSGHELPDLHGSSERRRACLEARDGTRMGNRTDRPWAAGGCKGCGVVPAEKKSWFCKNVKFFASLVSRGSGALPVAMPAILAPRRRPCSDRCGRRPWAGGQCAASLYARRRGGGGAAQAERPTTRGSARRSWRATASCTTCISGYAHTRA